MLYTHHFHIRFIEEGLSKDRYDKDVDEEGDKESDSWLDEEILVGFLYLLLIFAIDFTRLVKEQTEQQFNYRDWEHQSKVCTLSSSLVPLTYKNNL